MGKKKKKKASPPSDKKIKDPVEKAKDEEVKVPNAEEQSSVREEDAIPAADAAPVSEIADPDPEETVAGETAVPYEEAIEDLTIEDIPDGGSGKREKKRGGIFSLALYLVFICAFVVSAFMLGQNIYAKYRGGQIYDELSDIFENGGVGDSHAAAFKAPSPMKTLSENINRGGGEASDSGELSHVRASLASLSRVNPDVYGWIVVEGTTVNYPVVRGADNDYYLDHAYTGDYLPVGAIFADFRTADKVTDNVNLVIYGHNVADGSMFGCLSDVYVDQEFFDNSRIYLYTMDGIFTYRPICVHEPSVESGFIRTWFPSDEDYLSFLDWIVGDSKLTPPDVELDADSKILTLSTCTGRGHAERYVVHAVLISSVTD